MGSTAVIVAGTKQRVASPVRARLVYLLETHVRLTGGSICRYTCTAASLSRRLPIIPQIDQIALPLPNAIQGI